MVIVRHHIEDIEMGNDFVHKVGNICLLRVRAHGRREEHVVAAIIIRVSSLTVIIEFYLDHSDHLPVQKLSQFFDQSREVFFIMVRIRSLLVEYTYIVLNIF